MTPLMMEMEIDQQRSSGFISASVCALFREKHGVIFMGRSCETSKHWSKPFIEKKAQPTKSANKFWYFIIFNHQSNFKSTSNHPQCRIDNRYQHIYIYILYTHIKIQCYTLSKSKQHTPGYVFQKPLALETHFGCRLSAKLGSALENWASSTWVFSEKEVQVSQNMCLLWLIKVKQTNQSL